LAERTVDFAALSRISSRAELKNIFLAEVSAKCDPRMNGTLEPSLENDAEVIVHEGNRLEIACNYRFSVSVTQIQVAQATVKYLLEYELSGNEPFDESDIAEFAFANGTLHSWPFLRQFVYDLTSRMGFPPYTVPVFHFVPKPPQQDVVESNIPITPTPET
jgi:preprotein translocase subunit SecB